MENPKRKIHFSTFLTEYGLISVNAGRRNTRLIRISIGFSSKIYNVDFFVSIRSIQTFFFFSNFPVYECVKEKWLARPYPNSWKYKLKLGVIFEILFNYMWVNVCVLCVIQILLWPTSFQQQNSKFIVERNYRHFTPSLAVVCEASPRALKNSTTYFIFFVN